MQETKQRKCLKCRKDFVVVLKEGNYYTCSECRKDNKKVSDRYFPSNKGRRVSSTIEGRE